MKFLKKYWNLIGITILTLGLGALVFITSRQISQTKPVAPNVAQVKPKAAAPACTRTFAINIVTPTLTPTVSPTPIPTSTPTPTPTPQQQIVPNCTGLSVSPSSGTAPITVTITCSGISSNGVITAVDFNFGDGQSRTIEKNVGSPGSLSTVYTYAASGSFGVSCRVRDNNFVYSSIPDSCKQTVSLGSGNGTNGNTTNTTQTTTTVTGGGTIAQITPTAPPVPKIPVSGAGPSVLGATTIAGGVILLLLGLAL